MTPKPITVLSRVERAHEGNPQVTVWCPTCRERTVPSRQDSCMWCDTRLPKAAA